MFMTTDWDLAVLHYIHSFANPTLNLFFKYITELGGFRCMAAFLILLLLYARTRKIGLQILVAEILQLVLGGALLKPLIARLRPFVVDPTLELIIKAPETYSFPSGHSSTVFALFFAVMFSDCSRSWKLLAFCLAGLVGFSRLYLQVHYPTDVLAGACLGSVCGYLSSRLCTKPNALMQEVNCDGN